MILHREWYCAIPYQSFVQTIHTIPRDLLVAVVYITLTNATKYNPEFGISSQPSSSWTSELLSPTRTNTRGRFSLFPCLFQPIITRKRRFIKRLFTVLAATISVYHQNCILLSISFISIFITVFIPTMRRGKVSVTWCLLLITMSFHSRSILSLTTASAGGAYSNHHAASSRGGAVTHPKMSTSPATAAYESGSSSNNSIFDAGEMVVDDPSTVRSEKSRIGHMRRIM